MKKKSKILNKLFTVMLAVFCVALLCVPAFAATVPSDYNVIYEGSAVYYEVDEAGWFGDSSVYLDNLVKGETYLVIINDVSYTVAYNGHSFPCGQYEIMNDREMMLHIIGDCEDGETYNLIIAQQLSFDDRFSNLMSDASDIVDSSTGWIGEFIHCIVSNPLILCFVAVAFVGIGVGLISRIKK